MFQKIIIAIGAVAVGGTAIAADISGAGASFPNAIYSRWAELYRTQTGTKINYSSIGSGGGIKQIKAATVDFGASDKPLKPEELSASGLYQFPTVVGGVVPVINLKGLAAGRLHLTGQVLGDIFLGKVKAWNDPEIARLNPGLKLPGVPLTVVHRSDGSGTSFLFTSYLAMKNPEWSTKVGASDSVNWPTGLGGKGNDGVTAFVKQTEGAIGYVEYAYAHQNNLPYATVQNKAGKFVPAVAGSFAAAAASGRWNNSPGNYILLLDQPGANAWPITGATFILIYKNQKNAEAGASVLKFFDWAYKNGDAEAAKLDFVPLPATVKAAVRKQWAQITANGKPVYVAK